MLRYQGMMRVHKVLGIAGAATAGVAGAALVWRTMRARKTAADSETGDPPETIDATTIDNAAPDLTEADPKKSPASSTGPSMFKGSGSAGAMSVGVVDEVELGAGIARPTRGDLEPDAFDPEEVPSEHPEINELRNKMPFG